MNPHAILDFLDDSYRSASSTFFLSVNRVPPGRFLVADDRGARLRRYWEVPKRLLQMSRDECLEGFRAVMSRAIVDRTDAQTTTAMEVSGGHDSTCVAALALRSARCDGKRVFVSKVYPDHPNCDESVYLDAFENCFGIRTQRVPITLPQDPSRPHFSSAFGPYAEFLDAPYDRELGRLGVRTLMCGHGGDHVFWDSVALADLLDKGRYVELAMELVRMPRYGPQRRLYYARQALVGQPTLVAAKSFARGSCRLLKSPSPPPWAGDGLRSAWFERVWEEPKTDGGGFDSFLQRSTFHAVTGDSTAWRLDNIAIRRRSLGIEQATPFFAPEVVDFVLALPLDYRLRRGRGKRFLNDAMRGILPDPIIQRRTRTFFDTIAVDIASADLNTITVSDREDGWHIGEYCHWDRLCEEMRRKRRQETPGNGFSIRRLHRAIQLNRWVSRMKIRG